MYIDNETLFIINRVIGITEINEYIKIYNVKKIDNFYLITFPMEEYNFLIICNENGCVESMAFLDVNVISIDEFMQLSINEKKEILVKSGFLHMYYPYILNENQEKLEMPFYDIVFYNGDIYRFYINLLEDDFDIYEYKKINYMSANLVKYLNDTN